MFNFLGYEFQIKRVGNDIEYSYGIAEKREGVIVEFLNGHLLNISERGIWNY